MVLIAITIASSYFIWTLSQNTVYNDAIRQINQIDSNRMSESVQVQNTTYNVGSTNMISVSAQVQNQGSLSIQFVTFWIRISNETWTNYNFTKLSDMNLQAGAPYQFNMSIVVQGAITGASYSCASWLVTARGNVVALQQAQVSTNNIVISQTTQGIGALMMDFQNFTYYNVTKPGSSYILSGYPNGASGYFVQQGGLGIAFQVTITNVDPDMRTITLTAPSVLFSTFPTTPQQIRAAYWYIVNVNADGAISNTFTPVVLPFNVSTLVFFASSEMISGGTLFEPSSSIFTKTAPVNLALIGTISSDPFGQNIPFVSIYIAS